ncbi:hypothetical protein LSPH24S_03205 [Lysinibacillus sphaericus]
MGLEVARDLGRNSDSGTGYYMGRWCKVSPAIC